MLSNILTYIYILKKVKLNNIVIEILCQPELKIQKLITELHKDTLQEIENNRIDDLHSIIRENFGAESYTGFYQDERYKCPMKYIDYIRWSDIKTCSYAYWNSSVIAVNIKFIYPGIQNWDTFRVWLLSNFPNIQILLLHQNYSINKNMDIIKSFIMFIKLTKLRIFVFGDFDSEVFKNGKNYLQQWIEAMPKNSYHMLLRTDVVKNMKYKTEKRSEGKTLVIGTGRNNKYKIIKN